MAELQIRYTQAYNERLFEAGFRGWFHQGRFRWLRERAAEFSREPLRVIELGCFDGKVIQWLPVPPRRYLGFDANWEGGLDQARRKWADFPAAEFRAAKKPEDMETSERFDLAVCMETLEHLTDEQLAGYLDRIAAVTEQRFFVTVPNEIGPVCFVKQALKKVFWGGSIFSWSDMLKSLFGRTDSIVRDEHRGFNYRKLIRVLGQRFEVERVSGIPFGFLPPLFNFTVGIVLRAKSR